MVTTGTGTLDEKGEREFRVPTTAAHKNTVFSVRVKVTAKSEGSVTDRGFGGASVKVLEGSLVLSLRQRKFILAPGHKETLKIRLLNLQNKPAAGKDLKLEIYAAEWDKTTGFSKDARVTYKKVKTLEGQTNEMGLASLPFTIDKNGRYQIKVSVKDRKDRLIQSSLHYRVVDDSYRAFGAVLPELDLQSDKRFYRPGEKARILLTTAIKDADVLVTLEGDHIYKQLMVRVRGNSRLFELPLDSGSYPPNVYFTALTVSKGRLIHSALPVFVSPSSRFLKVDVRAEKKQYRPGDRVKLRIRTSNARGKGVRSTVALSVVDEAVFLVQNKLSPSIEKFFYGRRPNRTRLNYSFPLVFSGGAAKDENVDASVDRSKFKDTAYFKANVVTNTSGEAKLDFILPGNLTTWRITGVAADNKGQVGAGKRKFLATKELTARLSVPRFLNTSSSGKAVAIVRNMTGRTLRVKGRFSGRGLALSKRRPIIREIKPRRTVTFLTTVSAIRHDPKAKIRFYVESTDGKFKDSLEKNLPIYETGLNHTIASSGLVLRNSSEKRRERISLKDTAFGRPFRGVKYEAIIVPNLPAALLNSLDYLLEYPHGCVEQTTSRFLPNLEVLKFLRKNNIKNKKLEQKLERHIKAGVRNLFALQNEERGGWGWWQSRGGHAVNHWMTAYALYGLVSAKNSGYRVDELKLANGLDALKNMVLNTGRSKTSELDTNDHPQTASFTVFANYVLTLAGRGDPSLGDAMLILRKKMALESLAWSAAALLQERRYGDFKRIQGVIKVRAVAGTIQDKVNPNSSRPYYDALALRNIFSRSSRVKLAESYMARILREYRSYNGKIRSTRDTVATLYAIMSFLDGHKEYLRSDYQVELSLPGGWSRKFRLNVGADFLRTEKLDLPLEALKNKDRSLTVTYSGRGLAMVYLHAKIFEPTRTFEPRNNGIKITRSYRSEGGAAKTFSGSLINGEALQVEIKVRAPGRGSYLMVTENIPPGFVVESDFDYSYGRRNVVITRERIYFYAESYHGQETFRYRLRAVNSGSYLAPPARAELMYNDTVNGSTSAEVLKID